MPMSSLAGSSFHRLRTLLDIYSTRLASRLAVLLIFGLGVVLLAGSSVTGSGTAAIPFLLLVWANHERFLGTVSELLGRRPWLLVGLPMLVLAAVLIRFRPGAVDDLLRHIAVAYWPGGYRDMYVHTSLPPVSMYPSFDWLVGRMARAIGAVETMWAVQATAAAGFVAAFVGASRRTLAGSREPWVWTTGVLVLVLGVMIGRLMLGRPEIFLAIWTLAAVVATSPARVVGWTVAGMVLGTAYWLTPIYFPAVLLLPVGWRLRLGAFAALAFGWFVTWLWLGAGDPLAVLRWTLEAVANRDPEITVSENISIVNLLFWPWMLPLVALAVWAYRVPGADRTLLLVAAWFALSNQARYGSIVAPLLALFVLSAIRQREPVIRPLHRVAVLAAALALMQAVPMTVDRYDALPKFELPSGAVVLTAFDESTYSTLFHNPGTVRVAPAFEVGALDRRVQRLYLEMKNGSLDCRTARSFGFTHVIERYVTGAPPRCAVLVSTQGPWRLWAMDKDSP
jgi:hypothetical protein